MNINNAIYLLCLLVPLYSCAMEHQKVVKIDGDEFSYLTRARPIETLKNICIPAVALHIYNLAQTDSTYDVQNFNNFFLN